MGADQVAEIRPAIAELEADERDRGEAAPRFFARFSLADHPSPWVEVYLDDETVANLWYPIDAEPLAFLAHRGITLLPGARVVALEAGLTCTLAFDRASSRDVARFVDSLFLNLFGCDEDYAIDVEVRRFADPGGRPN